MYESESDLVAQFVEHLQSRASAWGALSVGREFDYASGRTDVVAVARNGEVLAFEAKLSRWRDALHQACRNRCFANRSFVVLPQPAAKRAARHEGEFRRRNVGLYSITPAGVTVLLTSGPNSPWMAWLTEKVQSLVQAEV